MEKSVKVFICLAAVVVCLVGCQSADYHRRQVKAPVGSADRWNRAT